MKLSFSHSSLSLSLLLALLSLDQSSASKKSSHHRNLHQKYLGTKKSTGHINHSALSSRATIPKVARDLEPNQPFAFDGPRSSSLTSDSNPFSSKFPSQSNLPSFADAPSVTISTKTKSTSTLSNHPTSSPSPTPVSLAKSATAPTPTPTTSTETPTSTPAHPVANNVLSQLAEYYKPSYSLRPLVLILTCAFAVGILVFIVSLIKCVCHKKKFANPKDYPNGFPWEKNDKLDGESEECKVHDEKDNLNYENVQLTRINTNTSCYKPPLHNQVGYDFDGESQLYRSPIGSYALPSPTAQSSRRNSDEAKEANLRYQANSPVNFEGNNRFLYSRQEESQHLQPKCF
ncbi:hypothetical protein O181_044646 [Austropuccinia psidii MF-1]|uniref:Uncharacterized protein n=1 Tax=Austropuccinia psidii MF-1 TaxID=1389203 RepID=A0A9Q3DIS0_9BASI|nr:hypothetical protein [Austropuccinia psidii MF-1]